MAIARGHLPRSKIEENYDGIREANDMDLITTLLSLLTGVALFLFGMSMMGDGLKAIAGAKLEHILNQLTNSKLKGLLLGTAVTAIIQSSSATTIMLVGFVNAGMMTVGRSISIIMGANIGTSITGWILCLSYLEGSGGIAQLLSTATISAVAILAGILLRMLSQKLSHRNVGNILIGFAILMIGMQTMSAAVSPLKDNPAFVRMLTMFSNPLLGILAGIAFTAVLQSSSASIGILQALSFTGSITFATALPIIMGIGVGAACPVLLSSVGSTKNGRRTALVYLIDDLFGMLLWSCVFYGVNAVVQFPFLNMVMDPVSIALLNSVFRIATVMVLLPMSGLIDKLVHALVRDSAEEIEDQADFDLLEERFLAYPAIALSQSRICINGMARRVEKSVLYSLELVAEFDQEKHDKVVSKENLIDQYEAKLGPYLMTLTSKKLEVIYSQQLSLFLHAISDFEQLGDEACYVAKSMLELRQSGTVFSWEARSELDVVVRAVAEITRKTIQAFQEGNNTLAREVSPLQEMIGVLCDELKLRHITRLRAQVCDLNQGSAFNSLLGAFEQIAAHCENVSVAMIKTEQNPSIRYTGPGNRHRLKNNEGYNLLYEQYEKKYELPQSEVVG